MINAILGRIDVFGTVVQFTRQEAAIVHTLTTAGIDGCSPESLCLLIFKEHDEERAKTLGVHMCNIRKKLPSAVRSVYNPLRRVYVLEEIR